MLPFGVIRENRIVLGEDVALWAMAPPWAVSVTLAAVVAGLAMGLVRSRQWLRFAGSLVGVGGIVLTLTIGARALLADAGELARVSPAIGFWLLLLALLLLMADALSAMRPGPGARFAILVGLLGAFGALLGSGALMDLSVMQEYAGRAASFWTAAQRHVALAIGSLAAAALVGFPLGILCHRRAKARGAVLPVLSLLQTIPSLAMFGLMIPILSWVGASVPGARAIGIAGIGFAPAFLALFLYSLLPVVSNTVAGLGTLPPATLEAATGMGMTTRQRLMRVELPLALPVILAAIRIVLVQNIGLAVIAGLIGGGGFGTFVFQGLNQTATDLILLGALPTVLMAIVAGVLMDICVDLTRRAPKGAAP
ncbi:osmoprotectant transport system permease protein [Tranquillimonas rosea]|uniref:Osmoprotectant transport system permease protein n=1 Tax=Tranquillimonas rosea TaxID=641238 RepID=A0A1H9WKG1_9RHOB|nr:ABC transporter permease [Tranquillimonas rosea]SES34355.1 osmoprotectant transport system permease protein [Tranquillimonas rosea]